MSESKVSIILTSYNRPHFLINAIQSVLHQTYENWELLVMDDNSLPENILPIKQRFTDQRIRFFNSDVNDHERLLKCRYAVNINQGLRESTGVYISYLTDDDDYLPHRLDMMAKYLDQHSDLNVVYGKQFCYYDGDYTLPVPWIRETHGVLESASCVVDHNSVMHRKSVIEEVGYWEEGPEYWGFADAVFWTKLTSAGHYFYPIDDVLDRHRFHEDSVQFKLSHGQNLI